VGQLFVGAMTATAHRPGTHLIELAIGHLDDVYEEAVMPRQGQRIAIVFSLPSTQGPCSCRANWLTRIPSGYFPIVTRFGKFMTSSGDPDDVENQKNGEEDYEAGGHFFPPWKNVSKLVTQSVIVFEVPLGDIKTKDNVTAALNVLVQFKIVHGRKFLEKCGADKLDLLLRAHMDEHSRSMASRMEVRQLYDLQGQDTDGSQQEPGELSQMKATFLPLGVEVLDFTVKSVKINNSLVKHMQDKTGFASQTLHLDANQRLAMQGLDNVMELQRMDEAGLIRRLEEEEKGQKVLATIDIDIAVEKAQKQKELALMKAKYEEDVAELMNNSQLEVQDLNNQRDSVTREVEAKTGKEKNELLADAWMYRRTQELEKVMKSAENVAQAKKLVAGAEADAADVLKNRREFEQQLKRLDVFESLAKNNNLRIAGKSEVDAGANLSFTPDTVDHLVQAGLQWAGGKFGAPLQQPLMGGTRRR